MAYRLFDFSSDQGVEGEGATPEQALIELGRAMAHVVTDGSKIQPAETRTIDAMGARDWHGTAVAWINELVFLFDTYQFLLADGSLTCEANQEGVRWIRGTVRGERFDPKRHQAGRGVKAATFHDASHQQEGDVHRFRLVLDL